MNNTLRNSLIDLTANLAAAGEFGRVAILDSVLAETDRQDKRIKELEKALKQSAASFHGSGLVRAKKYHTSGNFMNCANGWCMEAAEVLSKKTAY